MTSTPSRRRAARLGLAVLAGAGCLGAVAAPAQAAAGFDFSTRVAGETRVDTAVAASEALYPDGVPATDVVLVNRDALVDGLTASYVAGLKNAPILYTDVDSVPAATEREMDRLGAENVWIIGGTAMVSQHQEDALEADRSVIRFWGEDRYATAAAVARAGEFAPEEVYIASGTAYADALAAGPVAYARTYPILLTRVDGVPGATAKALEDLGTQTRTVLGGTAVVSESTYAALKGTARLGGANRQETAALVADDAIADEHFTRSNAALVSAGDVPADALVAAPAAGATGTPLLFIESKDELGAATSGYLMKHAADLTGRSWVFGGTAVVPQKVVEQAKAAAQG
ncbi:cell wall-binding repeat-containing protein [Quadrisphaera sp. DSM 44207]|uniref:cell wall-binding repeat-containing protein n=1 Tax=Quadrisphaera sp. DSM 44207 TaxID=1881057 RepID=UPI0008909E3D|nr:cell wall-binding repeat-containing protein [Quadrisphaera sp. DSM 44207]SDQ52673.1 Putative cell wall binding repeat 2 [Quadrisphaera sp. DSM 44207]